jgi:hypothetical protein
MKITPQYKLSDTLACSLTKLGQTKTLMESGKITFPQFMKNKRALEKRIEKSLPKINAITFQALIISEREGLGNVGIISDGEILTESKGKFSVRRNVKPLTKDQLNEITLARKEGLNERASDKEMGKELGKTLALKGVKVLETKIDGVIHEEKPCFQIVSRALLTDNNAVKRSKTAQKAIAKGLQGQAKLKAFLDSKGIKYKESDKLNQAKQKSLPIK